MIDEPSSEIIILSIVLRMWEHTAEILHKWETMWNSVIRRHNVLLLVGINHTGGWHYYGCDLLTCALLAHATSQKFYSTKCLLYIVYNVGPTQQTWILLVVCCSLLIGGAPFFKSFASYFNHYICSFKCENKCIAALKNDGQDKSAWKKIAFFAWEKPFFIMKLRTYLKHVVRHIRQCFKIMEEMVESQKWITFNNRKVEFQ